MNKLNKEGLDLIKTFEGLRLEAYKDAVGIWTIGYGHTASAGSPKPTPGMKITKDEAERILRTDLVKYEDPVKKLVHVDLNDNQYSALVSFVYNVGGGNFQSSTLLKKINLRDFNGAADEFLKWNKAGGKVLKGLTRRREAERALFLKAPQKVVQTINEIPVLVSTDLAEPTPKPSVSFLQLLLDMIVALFQNRKT